MSLVIVDSETDSLREDCQIIQLAAVAVDADLRELESFEVKLKFDVGLATIEALSKNHYNPAVWEVSAHPPTKGLDLFADFLRQHSHVMMVSKAGKPYTVARMAGYNSEFDGPRIKRHFQQFGKFLPAYPRVLCVLQKVDWYFQDRPQIKRPADLKQTTVCDYFGIPCGEAHDALADVKLTIALMKALRDKTN